MTPIHVIRNEFGDPLSKARSGGSESSADRIVFGFMTDFAPNMVAPTVASTEAPPSVHSGPEVELLRHNQDVDWKTFDPAAYWASNYQMLRNDDQSIVELVGEFFSRHFRNAPQLHLLRGLDVGSAGNLYPALAMLPWSETITLTDVTPANIAWLSQAAGPGANDEHGRWVWQPFWSEYARYVGYQQLPDPRAELAARHRVRPVNLFDLGGERWDLGTMFFVAESMTSYQDEFAAAVEAFTRALLPGAPFAMAFMDRSIGYTIAGRPFPAVRAVDAEMVRTVLSDLSADAVVTRLDVVAHDPAKDGYEGMIVATGTTRG